MLGIDGIKALMGFRCTIGSVKDALSPGWATLLGSFLAFNCTDVSSHVNIYVPNLKIY